MAFLFSKAKWAIGRKKIDLQVDTVAIILLMSNSSAPGEEDAEFIDDFTTLDEYDGTGYSRKLLNGKVLTQDTVNDVARLTADDIVWTALGAGTRACIGAILVHVVTDDSDSRPIAFTHPTSSVQLTHARFGVPSVCSIIWRFQRIGWWIRRSTHRNFEPTHRRENGIRRIVYFYESS